MGKSVALRGILLFRLIRIGKHICEQFHYLGENGTYPAENCVNRTVLSIVRI
jgi:hypothetical protein